MARTALSRDPILRQWVIRDWRPAARLDTQTQPLPTIGAGAQAVRCYQIRFTSIAWQGKAVRIFGFYGYPVRASGRLPGLLLVHGGGGYATLNRVIEGAHHGFATLSIDLPGKGPHRSISRSTGPDMTVPQIFDVQPDLESSYIFQAVIAQMRAISFLCSRPEVDPDRIGLAGVSWGGATGLLTTSLDHRVRCFVDIFGGGYLSEGSAWMKYFRRLPPGQLALWEANYDASEYLSGIHVPVLGETGTDDRCYWLPEFMKTMDAIHPRPDLILLPNLDHRLNPAGHQAFYRWLELHLDRRAAVHAGLEGFTIRRASDGLEIRVKAGGSVAVRSVRVGYFAVGPGAAADAYSGRIWQVASCQKGATPGWWGAVIPDGSPLIQLFATVTFADGLMLSTPIHTAFSRETPHGPIAIDIPSLCARLPSDRS